MMLFMGTHFHISSIHDTEVILKEKIKPFILPPPSSSPPTRMHTAFVYHLVREILITLFWDMWVEKFSRHSGGNLKFLSEGHISEKKGKERIRKLLEY